MRHRRYTYTPRRRTPSSSGFSLHPAPILAVAVIVFAAAAAALITTGGSGGEGEPPGDLPGTTLAVLGASCAAWQRCDASDDLTPTPRETAAVPQATPTGIEDADPPAITGVAAVVMEKACAAVLYSTNPEMERPPASLTKIMTALVAEENAGLDELVPVDVSGAEFSLETDSTIMGLEPGQTLTMRDLLYGLLLPSGNDAAIQIAEHVAGSVPAFVAMMNRKAVDLGLEHTHFANPHGLDDVGLYTSAYDMAIMGRELLQRPALAEIVGTQAYQPNWEGPAVGNLNQLLGFYPGSLGVKTGYTPLAGQTIVAAAEQGGRTIIVSVLGSHWDIYKDVSELLNWGFQSTEPACGADGLSLAR
jgi:serine-type D-Ala-D-Ala carboxypeptidase (penicillin-binding protein 5/6)